MNIYGWQGSFKEFIEINVDHLVNLLCMHIYNRPVEEAQINSAEKGTLSQINAWYDCIPKVYSNKRSN